MGYKYKYGKQMLYIIMDLNMLTFSYPNITHFSWWDISHQYYHIYDIYICIHMMNIYICIIIIIIIVIIIIIYRNNILAETSNEMVEESMRVEVAEFHQWADGSF